MKAGFVFFLFVIAMGSSFAAGYYYLKSQPVPTKTVADAFVTPTPTPTLTPAPAASSTGTPSVTPTGAPKAHTAVVIFEPPIGGEFADRAQIEAKIVAPFLDYYVDENGEGYLVSLAISENAKASKAQYPYAATAIFKNGGNSGFLIAKSGGSITWWVPDCMVCTFSAGFKAKYPDIVKNFQ